MSEQGPQDRTRTTPPAMDVRSFVSPTRAEDAPGDLDGLPERIGRYRLIRKIGEGGMGAVYQAEQENPRRAVALKLLLAGVASSRALRRFEFEAQVLGRLQHAGIAQIHEAGMVETAAGTRPYFAMEYVNGRTLLDHALFRKLSIRQRIALLVRIAEAVEHAHQKGVVHRDLKPANILVDVTGQPKVLDFGVARLTDVDLQATTLQTDAGQLVGTLAYMSPEQLAANSREIDTRSDVYALGVLGYELLANRMPYDLVGKSMVEVAQVIRLSDPTRLSRVNRALRGDLEVIFGRALAKEKERRYQSAAEFGADLARYLDDRPILARPPSTLYQIRKFVRRNKGVGAGMCIGLIALLAGAGLALRFGLIAAAERDAARLARDQAQLAAGEAQAVTRFLVDDMLAAANTRARGRDVKVVEVLESAANRASERFERQPLIRAGVENALGQTYMSLGAHPEAERLLRSALETRTRLLGVDNVDTATSMYWLGDLLNRMEKPAEGQPLSRQAYEIRARLLGPTHPDTLESLSDVGIHQASMNDWEQAEATLRRVLDVQLSSPDFGPNHERTFASMDKLSSVLQWRGKMEEAEALIRASLEGRRKALPNHPDLLISLGNAGDLYFNLGRFADAEAIFREAVDLARRVYGDVHSDVDRYRLGLADTLAELNQPDPAEAVYRDVLASPGADGGRHANARLARRRLARLFMQRRRFDEAVQLADEAVNVCRTVLGPDAIETGEALSMLGNARYRTGDVAGARDASIEALRVFDRKIGESYVSYAKVKSDLAAATSELGDVATAERMWDDVVRLDRARGRKSALANDLRSRADCLNQLGRVSEAEPLIRECLELEREIKNAGPRRAHLSNAVLGETLYRLGRRDEGEPLLLDSVARLLEDPEVDERERQREIARVVRCFESAGEPERAAEWKRRLSEIVPTSQPSGWQASDPPSPG